MYNITRFYYIYEKVVNLYIWIAQSKLKRPHHNIVSPGEASKATKNMMIYDFSI